MKPKNVVVLILLICFCFTINAQPFKEGYESGIILLSLNPINIDNESSSEDDLYSLYEENNNADPLLNIQIEIAKKASKFNTVVLLIPDEDTYDHIEDLYGFEYNSNIQSIIIKHDAAWIRDYGPYFNLKDSTMNILDANYHDSRYKNYKKSKVFEINQQREAIIEEILFYKELSELSPEEMQLLLLLIYGAEISTKKIDKFLDEIKLSYKNEIDNSINNLTIYKTYIDVLTDEFTQRFNDDQIPELIPEKIYDIQSYKIKKQNNFNLSGGNFLINDNCQCFTTTELILENSNNRNYIDSILTNNYGCKEVVYLNPLPGENIIKHIDMFLMPIDSNNLLLASFNPELEILKNEWEYSDYQNLNKYKSDINLAIEAEIAMRKNRKILKDKGFNVINLPSYLPKKYINNSLFNESTLFYPTILNCLIQISDDNNTVQVLMPFYADLNEEIYEYSKQIINDEFKRAYGNDKEIIIESIECTNSAMAQGAIHCLTLTIPKLHSKYFDSFYTSEKEKILNDILGF